MSTTIPILQLVGGIETDCRLSSPLRKRREILIFRGQRFERVFCASCGKSCGAVNAEQVPFIFALCERCEPYGALPLPQVPQVYIKEV